MRLGPPAGHVAVLQMKDAPSWKGTNRRSVCSQDCEEVRWSIFSATSSENLNDLVVNCSCRLTSYGTCFQSVALGSPWRYNIKNVFSPLLEVFNKCLKAFKHMSINNFYIQAYVLKVLQNN